MAATVICERKKSQIPGLSGSHLEFTTITFNPPPPQKKKESAEFYCVINWGKTSSNKKSPTAVYCTVYSLFEWGGQFYYDMSVN